MAYTDAGKGGEWGRVALLPLDDGENPELDGISLTAPQWGIGGGVPHYHQVGADVHTPFVVLTDTIERGTFVTTLEGMKVCTFHLVFSGIICWSGMWKRVGVPSSSLVRVEA